MRVFCAAAVQPGPQQHNNCALPRPHHALDAAPASLFSPDFAAHRVACLYGCVLRMQQMLVWMRSAVAPANMTPRSREGRVLGCASRRPSPYSALFSASRPHLLPAAVQPPGGARVTETPRKSRRKSAPQRFRAVAPYEVPGLHVWLIVAFGGSHCFPLSCARQPTQGFPMGCFWGVPAPV